MVAVPYTLLGCMGFMAWRLSRQTRRDDPADDMPPAE